MMKIYIFGGILISVFMSLVSCSPSSSSVRYRSDKEIVVTDKDSTVRFTAIDDLVNDSLYSVDSLCCGDELSESEDPGDLPENENAFDISELMKRVSTGTGENLISSDQSTYRERVLMEIIKYLNTPYKFGGNSMSGIDCSAFTQTVFREALSIPILRSAREQYTQGLVISDKSELKFGDLVFFNTRRRVRPGHVGIYIGDNLFAHASTKLGVTISSLDHNYYSARYMGARRIDDKDIF